MHHQDGQRAQHLHGEIAVRHAVHAVHRNAFKAQQSGFHLPVRLIGCPGQGTAADRRHVGPLSAVLQSLQIPQQHHGIGHQVMPEADRLRPLQMRIAGHDALFVLLGRVGQDLQQLSDQSADFVVFVPQGHPQVQGYLVVAAARRVKLFSRFSDPLGQNLLDKHVDVFAALVDPQLSCLQIFQDSGEAFCKGISFCFRDDPLRSQHGRMGDAAGDVLPGHSPVKPDGRVKVVRQRIGLSGGNAGPHLCHVFIFRPRLPAP